MPVVTWNPADLAQCALSNGNLTATNNVSAIGGTRATQNLNGGKFYWEVVMNSAGNVNTYVGVALSTANIAADITGTANGSAFVFLSNGTIYLTGTPTSGQLPAIGSGTVVCFAVDAPNQRFWARAAAGQWNGATLNGNPASGTGSVALPSATNWMPFVQTPSQPTYNTVLTANFGGTAFAFTPPVGFSAPTTPTLAQLTQIAAEQWASGDVALQAQLTQIALEQWAAVSLVNPQAVLTQIALEQWASVALASAGAPMVTMVM